MQTVALLFTVFNRKEMTLDCLRLCYAEIEAVKAEARYSFSIYLTDDGSTDGLSEAVLGLFPDVHIINGDGTLFWNRGMIAAWKAAAEKDFDFYLWMNNDTMPVNGSFAALLENSFYLGHRAIVVGTAVDSEGNLSYGGRTGKGRLVKPDPEIPVPCDIFNGNMVLVPKSVYEVLGTMEPKYTHGFGDFDYGVRAMKDDITVVVAPGILATCDRNPGIPAWRDASLPLGKRYHALMSPKGRPFGEQFLYDVRKSGILFALFHFLSINIKVIFPKRTR